jgi:hypothetical protein
VEKRASAGLEEGGAGVRAHVVGDAEGAERAAALGVHDALRDALAVELRELLDKVVVVEGDGAVGADGQRVLVAGDGGAGVGGGVLLVGHGVSPVSGGTGRCWLGWSAVGRAGGDR